MNFSYDITIIIPIYNSENYIVETIESILNQKGKTNYEVLLIDDGSTDNSAKICQKYSESDDRFKYIYKKNGGVSKARNLGLDLAQGKYILFLDSDDLLKKDTLQNVVSLFDRYYDDADILAYPIYLKKFEKLEEHIRFSNYSNEGLIDIANQPHFNQTTMNTVIKNLPKEEKVYFKEDLKLAEDALFNTTMVLRKEKIIVSSHGGYLYRKEVISASNRHSNPANIGNMLLDYFNSAINLVKSEKSSMYVQSIILYEIAWRMNSNALFPLHLEGIEKDLWHKSFVKVMNFISLETICTHPHFDPYFKTYFMGTYKKEQIKIENDATGIYFNDLNGKKQLKIKTFSIIYSRIQIIDNKLYVYGTIRNRGYNLISDEIELILKTKNKEISIDLKGDIPEDYYKSKIKTAKFFSFETYLDIDTKYEIWVRFRNIDYKTTHYFRENTIFYSKIPTNAVLKNERLFYFEKKSDFSSFVIGSTKDKTIIDKYHKDVNKLKKSGKYNKYYKLNKQISILSKFYQNRRIWIYNDRQGVFDNAYQQFLNDYKKNDGVKRYYIIDENDKSKMELNNIPKSMLIIRKSLKHKIIFLSAEYVITSYSSILDFSPYTLDVYSYLYNRFKYKLIYVQHGFLHAHLPQLYARSVSSIDKFVVSSKFEYDNLINIYDFREDDIIDVGMPRLDNLMFDPSKKTKKILIAPSWRNSLTGGLDENRNWRLDIESFKETDYYNNMKSLIYNEKLLNILKSTGYKIDVKLHPNFANVSELFPDNEIVHLITDSDIFNINEYSLLITDFSSFLFDFVQLKTKMVFYYPDYNQFICGNHSYNKLNLDMSDVVDTYSNVNDVVKFIEVNIQNNFKLSPEEYKYYDNLLYKPNNNKEALYNKLINLK